MEAVKRRFKIAVTAFHTISTLTMPRYSLPPFGISTIVYQIASSARTLSLNVICTRSTTNSHFYLSLSTPSSSPLSYLLYLPPVIALRSYLRSCSLLARTFSLSISFVLYVAADSATAASSCATSASASASAAYAAQFSCSHCRICLAHIR